MVRGTYTTRQRHLASAAPLIALAALALVAPGPALMLVPAALLAVVLLRGLFPGEQVIQRLRLAVARRPRRRAASVRIPRTRTTFVYRTGRAFAFALAMRPPPSAVLHSV